MEIKREIMKKYSFNEVYEASLKYFNSDEIAADVFAKKYALQDNDGKYLELTPTDMHKRLAKEFARIEKKYPNPMSEKEIFDLFDKFQYVIPQGSPMSGIGNPFKLQSYSNCFIKGTNIFTTKGIKSIENIEIGDEVVTHIGKVQKVLQIHKSALNDRQLFKIKIYRTPEISVTGNHKFWSISNEQIGWEEKPQWNSIESLRKGDWIAIPSNIEEIPTEEILDISTITSLLEYENKEYDVNDTSVSMITKFSYLAKNKKLIKSTRTNRPINRFWKIDCDFAFFLGLWYGDGCVFSDKKGSDNIRGITFTFGSHEKDLVSFISEYGQKLFGINSDVNDNTDIDGSIQIAFHSGLIGMVFEKMFGKSFSCKKFHQSIYKWDKERFTKLLAGMVTADGTVTADGDVRVTVTNKQLIDSFYHMGRSFGIPLGRSYGKIKYKGEYRLQHRIDFPKYHSIINHVKKTYEDDRIEKAKAKVESMVRMKNIDDTIFMRIDSKVKLNENHEFVYTFGVEEDHSYSVEGLVAQNCFVLDSPMDSYGGITHTDQEQVQLMKRRGGVGFDISNLRPKGLNVNNAAKTTDGIGVFMERFSNTTREVAQNSRRGALMLSISCHHPEIKAFATIKNDNKRVTGANISIRITDEFMNAVKKGEKVQLRFPVEKDVPHEYEEWVDAKELWTTIVTSARNHAEPGLLFWDTVQKRTPTESYKEDGFQSISTNPCITADTKVAVADGRGFVEIGQLAKEDKDVSVYAFDHKKNKYVIKTMRHPRVTGYQKDVYKVTLDDGSSFKATDNHRVFLNKKGYTAVKDLKAGDSMFLFTKFEASIKDMFPKASSKSQDYIWFKYFGTNRSKSEHRFIYESAYGEIPKHHVIHHIDYNAQNNALSNLRCMSVKDHNKLHAQDMMGKKNPIFKIKADPKRFAEYSAKMSESCSGAKNGNSKDVSHNEIREHAVKLAKKLNRRYSIQDWQTYAKENELPQQFTKYRLDALGSIIDLIKWAAKECNLPFIDEDPRVVQTYYDMLDQNYKAFISDGKVFVVKNCKECDNEVTFHHSRREGAFCSSTCINNYRINKTKDIEQARVDPFHNFWSSEAIKKKQDQLDIYTKLKFELGRNPILAEWQKACIDHGIVRRLNTKYGFTFKELKEAAKDYNHRVVSIEYIGKEDVYNGTVDDVHNFFIGGWEAETDTGKKKWITVLLENCGEVLLSGRDSCRLIAINLFSFVNNPFEETAVFDFTRFREVSYKAQRLMDNLVDLEIEAIDKIIAKVKSDPEPERVKRIELELWEGIKKSAIEGRRTGLGITALGDTLAGLNVIYGSDKSVEVTEKIYKTLAIGAYHSTCDMAGERGPFEVFSHKKEKDHIFIQQMINADEELAKSYKKNGRRNIALTTTAPTGTVSIMTQTTNGIEPAFFIAYKRRRKINFEDQTSRTDFVDQSGDKWQEYDVYHHKFQMWKDITGKENVEDSPYHKATANDINWTNKIAVQAVAQKWICHSISNTTNLPEDVSVETVQDIYMKGWELGCKGVTIYREGSRSGVIVRDTFLQHNHPPRPKVLSCNIHQVKIKGEAWTILVGLMEGKPYEVFGGLASFVEIPKKYKIGKLEKHPKKAKPSVYDLMFGEGDNGFKIKDIARTFDNPTEGAFTRTISLALRTGAPVQSVVEQLLKDERNSDMFSFSRVMARVLKEYIPNGTEATTAKVCPECESDKIIYQEGCLTCAQCAWSKCS